MELQAKSSQELQQALDRVQAAETRIRDLEERQRQFDEQEQEAERLRVDLSDAIVRSRELATEVEELPADVGGVTARGTLGPDHAGAGRHRA